MENQPTTLDKAVKVSIIAGALIIALSLAYYLVIFLPQKEKARVEELKQGQAMQIEEKEARAASLSECLEKNRASQINNNLNHVEMQKAGKITNTDLNSMIDDNNKRFKENENNCYKRYPQN
jgi:hypothetical protein